ncbi:hypothetical protein DUNSADRAFT_7491 [Dunaliella salina]|uniref:Uncharacterized protein n=1 Tax=Dunaliella salina TaxID=3046 RepID=A0ABQ7FTD0_DUNSA|nr:hypothetical protein DUNSADRAFT_7491 [Dunaliella salina]|eukprot:KAF5825708.1 hypothetical protein DUNSADRAFT_7491 [Dunaliella salina]
MSSSKRSRSVAEGKGPTSLDLIVMGYAGPLTPGRDIMWAAELLMFLPAGEALMSGVDSATKDIVLVVCRGSAVGEVRACLADVPLGGRVRLEGAQQLGSARQYLQFITAPVLGRFVLDSCAACAALPLPVSVVCDVFVDFLVPAGTVLGVRSGLYLRCRGPECSCLQRGTRQLRCIVLLPWLGVFVVWNVHVVFLM